MIFNPEIFRAYDIRGIYGQDFDDDFAFQLGAVLVRYLNRKSFLIAHDDRIFSGNLAESVARGIVSAGGDVEFLGLVTTPFFNFVFKKLGANGGVMVTASHNDLRYGGFKIIGEKGRIIGLTGGLGQIRDLLAKEKPVEASRYGGKVKRIERPKMLKRYIEEVFKKADFKPKKLKNLKVKISAPATAQEEVGTFLKLINLENRETDFEIAFAFDNDGDRLLVFDRNGNLIQSDMITGLLVQNVIRFWSKPKVVYDLRFSRGVLAKFDEWGIKSFRSRAGRIFVREGVLERRADIGGELSGHIFFKKMDYRECPLLAILKLFKILMKKKKSIEVLVEPFATWFNSGETNFQFAGDKQQLASIFEKLESKYKDGKIDKLDGVSVDYPDWWFNLRPSNTEPLLRLVVEAKTKELLEGKLAELMGIIRAA